MDLTPVLDAVAHEYDICPADLLSRTRRQPVASARQLVMYLLRNTTPLTLQDIGTAIGRHHATVIHGIDTIDQRRVQDRILDERIRRLSKEITP